MGAASVWLFHHVMHRLFVGYNGRDCAVFTVNLCAFNGCSRAHEIAGAARPTDVPPEFQHDDAMVGQLAFDRFISAYQLPFGGACQLIDALYQHAAIPRAA